MPDLQEHPTDAALEAFALGKLALAESRQVEEHLAGCDRCQDRAEAIASDTLVDLLTAAPGHLASRSKAPTPSYAETKGWSGPAVAPTLPLGIPGVLAGHPKYRVIRQLGVGGMGSVWLAEHTVMNRPVAIKVIRPELLSRPSASERFMREVRSAAKLHHPNIVTAFDAEAVDGSCLLVMEYVPGETLADRVRRGPLPALEASRIVQDAARGLAHAHAAGLVHRDVKPHNLIQAADGTVKVLDFGLAGVRAGETIATGGELTGAGTVFGTPDYIAPEQIADPHAVDARADVYGLGCTFYHLLAGRPPVPEGPTMEKLTAQKEETPPPVPELAGDLAAVLAKMLAKRPEDRYQSAEEVVDALETIRSRVPPASGPSVPPGRKPARRWIVAAVLVLFAVVFVLGWLWLSFYSDNREITIATDDPDLQVVMKRNGELVSIKDTKTGETWDLDAFKNQIGQADKPDGLKIDIPGKEPIVLRRAGKKSFSIEHVPIDVDGPTWFEDVTDRVGLNFIHDPGGNLGSYFMPQIMGSGCAIADLDGDGLPDLVLLTNGGPGSKSTNKLFRQKPDGTFEDVTRGSGLDFPGYNMGIAIGDVNNDGLPDLVITQYNGVKLLLNLGGMKFRDVTVEAGLSNPLWGTSAAFLDYDRDGWLDLVIVNYVAYDPDRACHQASGTLDYCSPGTFRGTATKLFHNRGAVRGKGSPVSFEDVTVTSHLGDKPSPGLGVVVADFDGDGWPDVFVANDGQPNHLWINKRDGTFADEALSRGVARTSMGHAFAGMGVAAGDVDNRGLLDLYVTHLTGETNTLWMQGPRGQFRDVSAVRGLTATRWRGTGFGTLMADFTNSGRLDIAVVNGGVARGSSPRRDTGLAPHWEPYAERNQLLANTGDGRFHDISPNNPALCGYWTVARGLACGDLRRDGTLWLLVNAVGEKARLFKVVAPNRGHWMAVRAIDPALKRDAVGAEILVKAGGVSRLRLIGSGDSYLSAGPLVAHVGLGSIDRVDGYAVTWPDGCRERFPGGPADRYIELRKGEGSR